MRLFILTFLVLGALNGFSQVGINTTSPSEKSVIDIRSSSDGTSFGGFLPPRVTLAERDLIQPDPADEGMLVYVINPPNSQLQIWDGTAWRTLFPQSIEFSAVLAGWEMDGLTNYGLSPYNATVTSASVTVGGLTRGSGLSTGGTAAGDAWGSAGWYSAAPTETQATSIANNKFVTFTITPNFGINLSITAIEPFRVQRSGTGPQNGIFQYSLDGVNFIDIGTVFTYPIVGAPGNQIPSFDLSGIADLQNLTSTTTVTFRLVNWGATGTGGTWYIIDQNAGPDFIIRGNLN